MTVVVDASVLVAALVDAGREGKWAESVLSANSSAAPELALVETSNILRRLEQAGQISRLEATSLYFSPRGEAKCAGGPSGRGARLNTARGSRRASPPEAA